LGKRKVYTREELLEILNKYINNKGVVPKQTDFKPFNGLPSFNVYYKNFGSLKNIYTILCIDEIDNLRFNKKIYTDNELLNILKEETIKHLNNNLFLITEEEFNNHPILPHSSIYQRRFGGVINSYKLIGYDYDKYNRKALEIDMIFKFKQLEKELKHTPNSREIDKYSKLNKCYATKTYSEHFGSIYKLQVLCGFIPTKMGINRTEREMIDDLIKLSELINDTPTSQDIDCCEFTCCSTHYFNKFGTLENVLKLAGFPDDKIRKNYILTNNGTKCYSKYEYRFATVIENNNIIFDKEIYYKDIINGLDNRYKIDFIITYYNKKFCIEIFGIENNKNYDIKTKNIINICKENNIPLICFYPKDFWSISNEELFILLINKLNNSVFYEYKDIA